MNGSAKRQHTASLPCPTDQGYTQHFFEWIIQAAKVLLNKIYNFTELTVLNLAGQGSRYTSRSLLFLNIIQK